MITYEEFVDAGATLHAKLKSGKLEGVSYATGRTVVYGWSQQELGSVSVNDGLHEHEKRTGLVHFLYHVRKAIGEERNERGLTAAKDEVDVLAAATRMHFYREHADTLLDEVVDLFRSPQGNKRVAISPIVLPAYNAAEAEWLARSAVEQVGSLYERYEKFATRLEVPMEPDVTRLLETEGAR